MNWTMPYPWRSRSDSVRRINMSSEPGNESFFCALRPIPRILSLRRRYARVKFRLASPRAARRFRGAHARRMRIAMARAAAVDNGLRPISTGVKLSERSVQVVGKPEVILRPDLSGGQVVNVFLYCVGLSQTDDPLPKRPKTLLAILQSLRLGGRQRGFDVGCSIPVHQGIPIRTERCRCHCFITFKLHDSVTFRAFAKRQKWRD